MGAALQDDLDWQVILVVRRCSRIREVRDLPETYGDELFHERLWKRSIDGEVQRAAGAPISCDVIAEFG